MRKMAKLILDDGKYVKKEHGIESMCCLLKKKLFYLRHL